VTRPAPPVTQPLVVNEPKPVDIIKPPIKRTNHPKAVAEPLPPPVIETATGSAVCDPWRAQHGQCTK
jgi:hypothetical protein